LGAFVPRTPEIALLVSTYQRPYHLRRVLLSIALQQAAGDMEVVITDDGSRDDTPSVVADFARSVQFPVRFTTHAHEAFQLARCRNEGVAASTAQYLLFLDGDCLIPPDHVAIHLRERRRGWVHAGYCVRFNQQLTEQITEEVVARGDFLRWVPPDELRNLRSLDRKARLYNLLRHPTKPKLFGGNIGIWRSDYLRVNGYNEDFVGWGCEDDDLRLRLRQAGVRIRSILRWTRTYHLWHPADPTAPRIWREGANVPALLRRARLTRCINGLVKRRMEELRLRVVGGDEQIDAVGRLLGAPVAPAADTANRPEIEILCHPGEGSFSGRADCNVLVVLEERPETVKFVRKAHVVVAPRQLDGLAGRPCFALDDFRSALRAVG
jgi:glycosyltransferase involved in cell wall biosynthesis